MEEDVHTPGNILFTQDYGIKTTDGVTTTTIAGSTSRSGYREGTGSGASFSYLKGFAQIVSQLIHMINSNAFHLTSMILDQGYPLHLYI